MIDGSLFLSFFDSSFTFHRCRQPLLAAMSPTPSSIDSASASSLEPVPGETLLFFLLALALFYYVFRVAKRTFAGRQSVARAVKAATEGEDD